MKFNIKPYFPIYLVFPLMMAEVVMGQNTSVARDDNGSTTTHQVWSPEELEVKATIEHFLIVAGNYELDAMAKMMATKANVGTTRLRDGKWITETILFTDYFEGTKGKTNRPYYEPVYDFTIYVSEGQLAFVKADAVLHAFGVPLLHNIDYFTLIKENEVWKFINISFTSTRIPEAERIYDPIAFAKGYAQAWCSQNPDFVSMFYTEDGSLKINNGNASVGRTAIAKDAKAFMDAFPDDMVVAFDKLVKTAKGVEFHWTLTGTNTGPKGTGKKVNIKGFELWRLDEKGLIKESKGTFDTEEYSKQLKNGVEK